MMHPKNERGQALVETLMLTMVLVMMFAALYQLFLANEAIYRAMTAAHQALFNLAFKADCYYSGGACDYETDQRAHVIWRPYDIPEVRIPIMGIFKPYGLQPGARLISNVLVIDDACPAPQAPCKRSTMAAGTYEIPASTLERSGVLTTPGWEAELDSEIGWIRR